MKTFSLYHKDTGFFTGRTLTCDAAHFRQNVPDGMSVIAGVYDHLSQRVDLSGPKAVVIDYKPAQPSEHHEWNASTRRWQLHAAAAGRIAARATALHQIAQLELASSRAMRELALSITPEATSAALDRLRALDSKIAELRKDLP